jgi:CRISPR-associated endonuclease/helicase Cas3
LLDEAHLAEPFRQTLETVQRYQGPRWRQGDESVPWQFAVLSATPRQDEPDAHATEEEFTLQDADREHPILRDRLEAPKPARLMLTKPGKGEASDGPGSRAYRARALCDATKSALEHFSAAEGGVTYPAIGVIVNRVARAREVHRALQDDPAIRDAGANLLLLIGPSRPIDREDTVRDLEPIQTGADERLSRPLVVVATQTIEAGVDIDLDGMVTELAALDALRQRFGRLNRAGRKMKPYAAIVACKPDLSTRYEDPVYGSALRATWEYLSQNPDGGEDKTPIVNFGIAAFDRRTSDTPPPPDVTSPSSDAPVLMPAHVDLLSQTSPIPEADPEVGLYLHGPQREADSVSVLWRADLFDPRSMSEQEPATILTLARPRAQEMVQLPLWAVRAWLESPSAGAGDLADVPAMAPSKETTARSKPREGFVWRGDADSSGWRLPSQIRPGDTVVVPAAYGGLDRYGWSPGTTDVVTDVADASAAAFWPRYYALRVAPGLLPRGIAPEALGDAIAGAASQGWGDVRDAILSLLPASGPDEDESKNQLRERLERLDDAKGPVELYRDLYGEDAQGRPRGVVFVSRRGVRAVAGADSSDTDGVPSSTEDDLTGSVVGYALSLEQHSKDVEDRARALARQASLPPARVRDVELAGLLHDEGKADGRFQAWLQWGDPLAAVDPLDAGSTRILAKSGRRLPPVARRASQLPHLWRHEADSVRRAVADDRLKGAEDADLTLWLVGTHHGHGRPLFPHAEPNQGIADAGPQSLAFDWRGRDWATLFRDLKARYGVWALAHMEAVLRLADHRASENAERRISEDAGGQR